MRRRLILFGVLLGSLLAVPIGMTAWSEVRLATGRRVLLEVRPVDPNDPFRGEYVALTYPISRTPLPPGAQVGDTVYVGLFPDGATWRAAGSAGKQPPSGELPFIRGHVAPGNVIFFGIETFYVEEGRAREYEEAIVRGAVVADVVLDGDGGARLADLLIRD